MKSKSKLGLAAVMICAMALVIILGSVGGGSATEAPDPVSCYCTMPSLSLGTSNIYWADLADYNAHHLSVDYNISNTSSNYANAKDMTIVGTVDTAGVTFVDGGRVINMVSVGECELVTVKYFIPVGVGSFTSSVYATANDQCGNSYAYPGPYPVT